MDALANASNFGTELYYFDATHSTGSIKPEGEEYKKSALKNKIEQVVQHIFAVVVATFLATFISIGTGGIAIVPIVAGIAFGVTTLGSIAHLFGKIFPQMDKDAREDEEREINDSTIKASQSNETSDDWWMEADSVTKYNALKTDDEF